VEVQSSATVAGLEFLDEKMMQTNPIFARRILTDNRIRPSKKRGQHFIVDEKVVERQVAYADLKASDIVYEIGAGLGALTEVLAGKGSKVVSIEIDARLLKVISHKFNESANVSLLRADALSFEMRGFGKVVSNIPYNLSSQITFKILDSEFEVAILAYQIDFAKRMIAKAGSKEYGRLSVNINYRANVEILDKISRYSFFPIPLVDSAIVRLERREPPFNVDNERFFFKVLRELFPYRNQMLRKVLKRFLLRNGFTGVDVVKVINDAHIEDDRIRNLQPESFARLSNSLVHMVDL
jgi:16S rRNA (adenine1518-N6/adenine1519-N6)-dimethyltransferase